MKKEDIHLKPLTPGEVARFTVTERAVCAGERSLFLPGEYKIRTNSVGETCGLPFYNTAGASPRPTG